MIKVVSIALLLCLPLVMWTVSGYRHEHLPAVVFVSTLMFFTIGLVNLVKVVKDKR